MLLSSYKASSTRVSEMIFYSVFTTPIDLEFSLDRIFNSVNSFAVVCFWPHEKIMEEVRRGFKQLFEKAGGGAILSNGWSLTAWFFHVVVDLNEQTVFVFVPRNQNVDVSKYSAENATIKDVEKDMGLPVYSFLYR